MMNSAELLQSQIDHATARLREAEATYANDPSFETQEAWIAYADINYYRELISDLETDLNLLIFWESDPRLTGEGE